ncbi:sensor histidine kinase [Paraburkholderia kururiensis]|uniref:histidine kinase n=1 Tax=Paraburkholderia kururiensis TaxID=984307 RepID=A0ABZ0WNL7_9BURK|nr:HAMP domain-containing sensor histidine kinase [Paraburkholderia kururiensis]WQD78984.1 HAMP domain-containing sensor histidine kinase [Paraburkholderia kururiensis]
MATSLSRAERVARLCAETALFMRDHVLSVVSHDMRSPLNAVHSWAYVLERKIDAGDATAQRALTGIRTGIEQQVKLLEDVVDTTRSETRKLAIEREPFGLRALVDAAVGEVRAGLADARGVTIVVDTPLTSEQVTGDRERISQALWLMLTFATEASARGGTVLLAAASIGTSAHFNVAYSPSPQTLTDESLPHLLEAFARRQAQEPREAGRIAWVLSLCRRVAEAHGGAFEQAMPEAGKSATLALHVPLMAG